jgi:hypothetical protein
MPARLPVLVLLVSLARPAVAGPPSPRDELLRLVPADTAVCFVVQGIREQSRTVAASPFAGWAADRLRPKLAATPEAGQLKTVEQFLTAALGVSLADIRDDILGDAVVLAYQPGPPGKPDDDRGVVMLKARDPAKLRKLLDALNAAQRADGSLFGLADRTYRDHAYVERQKAGGRGEFYFVRDGLFLFAAQESALKAVIDRAADPAAPPAPVVQSLDRLGVKDAFLVCGVGPRALDPLLEASVAAATTDAERAFRRQFARLWAAVDGAAVYLDVGAAVEVGGAVQFRPDALPPELRPLLASPPTASALWGGVPADALAAVGGRADVPRLLAAVESFLPDDGRAAFRKEFEQTVGAVVGKDVLADVLAGVGPDWAAWATPPESGAWLPAWAAAVRVRGDANPAVPAAARDALGAFALLVRIEYNRTHDDQIRLTEDSDGGRPVTVLANPKGFPPGFRPAFGLTDGFLVACSSPAVVRGFAAPSKATAAGEEVPFLRVSAAGVRGYLTAHAGPLAKWVAERQGRSEDEVRSGLLKLADVLEAFDRFEVFARGDGSRLRLALRVTPVKPLR